MNSWLNLLLIRPLKTCILSLGLGTIFVTSVFWCEAIAQPAQIQSIQGKGKVQIQRKNRTNWDLGSVGKEIENGDQIYPDKGVKVRMRCLGKKDLVRVRPGVVSHINSICIKRAVRIKGMGDP
jgi:hypothetical protein